MRRTPMVTGNWKMHTLRTEAVDLARGIREGADGIAGVDKVVCPPFPYLHEVAAAVAGSSIHVGAQNAYWEEKGAFTGEVSVTQVAEVAKYVLAGHSERRQFFGETDETVNRRVKALLAHGVTPIMCVGETLDERNAGRTADVLVRQVCGGIEGVTIDASFIVAYEPVWAIGTGHAADGPMAQKAIGLIRQTLRDVAGAVADDVRILYGGSVTPDNIAEFMAQADIDGGLVGGASLKAAAFTEIIRATASAVAARA